MVTAGELQAHEESFIAYFLLHSLKREDLTRVAAIVRPSDFYSTFHADVWQTMLNMSDVSEDDPDGTSWNNYLLVAERLCNSPIDSRFRNWNLSEVIARLSTMCELRLTDFYTSMAQVHTAATMIRNEAQQRVLRSAMMSALDATTDDDFHNCVDDLRARMQTYTRKTRSVSTVWDNLERWKGECERAEDGRAVNIGWPTIDRAFGLIRGGEVVILAARAGVGKTWGLASIALHNALMERNTLICSLEQPGSEMAERIVAQSLNITPRDMRVSHGNLNVADAREHMPHLDHMLIYDEPISVHQIEAVVKKCMIDGFTPDMVCIDFLQLLKWDGKPTTIYQQASETARELKFVAKRIGVPIIVLSQLSREAGDGYEEPSMDMLRDSGAIEEAADRIMLMWKQQTGGVYVKIGKNRHGVDRASCLLRYSNGMRMEEAGFAGA